MTQDTRRRWTNQNRHTKWNIMYFVKRKKIVLTIPVLLLTKTMPVASSEWYNTMDDLQSQSMNLFIKFGKAIFEANLIYKKGALVDLLCIKLR